MSFWKIDNTFNGEKFEVDRIKQKIVETHEFTIRDDTFEEYPDWCKTFMDSNGPLRASSSGDDVLLCRNKKELKKFISWLIIAYKEIFND